MAIGLDLFLYLEFLLLWVPEIQLLDAPLSLLVFLWTTKTTRKAVHQEVSEVGSHVFKGIGMGPPAGKTKLTSAQIGGSNFIYNTPRCKRQVSLNIVRVQYVWKACVRLIIVRWVGYTSISSHTTVHVKGGYF